MTWCPLGPLKSLSEEQIDFYYTSTMPSFLPNRFEGIEPRYVVGYLPRRRRAWWSRRYRRNITAVVSALSRRYKVILVNPLSSKRLVPTGELEKAGAIVLSRSGSALWVQFAKHNEHLTRDDLVALGSEESA